MTQKGSQGGARPRQHAMAMVIMGLTVATLLLAACRAGPTKEGADGSGLGREVAAEGGIYTLLSADELAAMLDDEDLIVVNVHIPYEGEIEQTDLHIPYNAIGEHRSEMPGDPGAKIVVYCRSGPMSAQAARELVALGFTRVYDLDGGMVAWERAGFELAQADRAP